MADQIVHRGPDSAGEWVDPSVGLVLAHRRLSIIDLSEAGAQPMVSACGRYVICYNGEVYNAEELRSALAPRGIAFRGHSDTEAVLEACAAWGVEEAVGRFVGMFAFALWDREERRLYLVRDRMGIKPLYYARFNGSLLFASELGAFLTYPGFSSSLDPIAIGGFLRFGYIPAPRSIYESVSKLMPGTILAVSAGEAESVKEYWSLGQVVRGARTDISIDSTEEAAEMLEPLLQDAVKCRMLADVGIGSFLSGGIDSSLVSALMQEASNRPIKTFSIGFGDSTYNEAPYAEEVARSINSDHTELYIEPKDLLDVVPSLPNVYGEPFADSSQIPTLVLSRLTREHVTVALSGDGGDELFAGYNRYLWAEKMAFVRKRLPAPLRNGLARLIGAVPSWVWESGVQAIVDRQWGAGSSVARRMHKIESILRARDNDDAYMRLISHWTDLMPLNGEQMSPSYNCPRSVDLTAPVERMQFIDMLTYLPDDILTKVDRASMAHSLEVRVPLLDHRIVETSWKMGLSAKLKNGLGKKVLRHILYRRVPRELLDRPKMGFAVPLDRWLRRELYPWARDIVFDTDWQSDFGIPARPIHETWERHCSGRDNWADQLWVVLMLGAWQRDPTRGFQR